MSVLLGRWEFAGRRLTQIHLPQLVGHIVVLCVACGLCGWFLSHVPLHASSSLSVGATTYPTVHSFHAAENSDDGDAFRWTDGESYVVFPAQGIGPHTLRFTMRAPHPETANVPVVISVNDQPVLETTVTPQLRHYEAFVPAEQVHLTENVVQIKSETYRPPDDQRVLGVAVFDATWTQLYPQRWLVPVQIAVITLVSGLLFWFMVRAGVGFWTRLLVLALFLAITLAMRHSDARFLFRWNAIWYTLILVVPLIVGCFATRGWSSKQATPQLPLQQWIGGHWPALIGFVALTGALFYPLLLNYTSHIVGAPGDAYEYLWKMQWFSDALIQQQVSPSYVPHHFYPIGFELAFSEMTPAHTLLGLPLTALFGSVISYNTVLLLSYILTGFFTYLLALRLGAPRGVAFIAGIMFAFCFRRLYHSSGHLPLMGTQWLVLTLYGWEGVLTRRRVWDGVVTGIGMALTMWTSWYYGTTFALFLACYTPLRLGIRHLPSLVGHWKPILVAGMLTVVLTLPLAQPYFEVRQNDVSDDFQHNVDHLLLHSVLPHEYLLPSPTHPVWGSWASQFYRWDGGERFATLGYTVLILALAGLWFGRRSRVVQALGIIVLINVIMSLGIDLRVSDTQSIPLPASFFYHYVPILDSIRGWSRMTTYVMLCTALLAIFALVRIPRRWYRPSMVLVASLVAFELWFTIGLSDPSPRAVDLWLRDQPGSGAVIQLPGNHGGSAQVSSLITEKPINWGAGTFIPLHYNEAWKTMQTFPSRASLAVLQRWETDYIIVDEVPMSEREPQWEAMLEADDLATRVYRDEEYSVYRLSR